MPVFLLIGSASKHATQLADHFGNSYRIAVVTGEYPSVRSSLANMDGDTLYIVPGLSKPERYEIFCLARKNETRLVSVAASTSDGLVSSDKNPLVMGEFDGAEAAAALDNGCIASTTANRRSKNLSKHSLGRIKAMVNRINLEYLRTNGQVACIVRECEDRFLRMWSCNQHEPADKLEDCYRSIIRTALEAKGIADFGGH